MKTEDIARLPFRPNAGIMLVNPAGRIWAGQRIDAMRLGTGETAWQMPQGGIEKGEEPRLAALRELEEEISVPPALVEIEAEYPDWLTYDLPHEVVPKIWKGRYRGQKQRWFLMRFRGSDDQIVIETKHPEFRLWQWMEPDDLATHVVQFKRETYLRLLDAFGDRL